MKVFIAEDDVFISDELRDILIELGYDVCEIGYDLSSSKEILELEKPDLAILDIKMHGEMTGFEIARVVTEELKIPFVFLTSFSDKETVSQAVKYKPASYLLKPFKKSNIYSCLEVVKQNIEAEKDIITIKDGRKSHRVEVNDILWVQVKDKYIEVITNTNRIVTRSSLSDFQEQIKSNYLVRSHRSFLVNINKVEFYNSSKVKVGEKIIPVSRKYREHLKIKSET